ncbi:DUF4150 domain-containing protein [Burkholderia cepacia]|nr:DUF4150 domain-containing protein [Burkholderia cepacia]NLA21372.1 DUF4150 domain-containing protein [Burkholderia cepacia]
MTGRHRGIYSDRQQADQCSFEKRGIATCAAPDFCKTPGAGVVPYTNVAFSRDLVNGSKTVRTNGVPAALKESEFKPSYGDEPGVGGGVVSGVNRGWAKFTNYSYDVKIEGRNVARLSDPMMMNGNNPNTNTPAEVQSNLLDQGGILCRIFAGAMRGMMVATSSRSRKCRRAG